MVVTADIAEVRNEVRAARRLGKTIGCVPTMGALHDGHVSLIEACRRASDFVAVTIFVNPSQFGPSEDLDRYPRPLEVDLERCRAARADLVFTPQVASLYSADFQTWVTNEALSTVWEGEARPTHFRGVTTIVTKLFNIVQPDVACFGAKDYQQQTIIRKMVRDLDLPIEILVCPTVREPDGLALSSRNMYLSPAQRKAALALSRALFCARDALVSGEADLHGIQTMMVDELNSEAEVTVDYAVLVDPESLIPLTQLQPRMVALIAARVGPTRLIDNLLIELN